VPLQRITDRLVEREELATTRPGFVLSYTETGTSYSGLPDRLATLRAGSAINLPVGDLPPHARIGLDTRWNHRATLAPDGSITLSGDHGEWTIENGV
jgi:hypothetical protein